MDAVFILHEGCVVDCNANATELFGLPRDHLIQEFESMLGKSGPLHDPMTRALAGEEVTVEWRASRPGGSQFDIECTLGPIRVSGAVHVVAVAVDVTARRRSERTLAELSGRLLQLQDEERRRIARELHDNTGQNLGALSINLSMMLAAAPKFDDRVRESLEESIKLVDSCIREIRTMSYLLHPPLLDELGLESTLRAYAEGYSERTGIRLDLDLPAGMPRLPQAVEIALFRIVQEGLSNIHRHSGSATATLRLALAADRADLELIDYGRGLAAGTLDTDVASASRVGVGIAGMRERSRQLGGRLAIASGPNGATLRVTVPIPRIRSKPARG